MPGPGAFKVAGEILPEVADIGLAALERARSALTAELGGESPSLSRIVKDMANSSIQHLAAADEKPAMHFTDGPSLATETHTESGIPEHLSAERTGRSSAISQYSQDEMTPGTGYFASSRYRWTEFRTTAAERQLEMLSQRPALMRYLSTRSNLDVLEIGASSNAYVPQILEERLRQYVAVELYSRAGMTSAWRYHLNAAGLSLDNKFRVSGNAVELPIATASQDVVYASHVDPFVFANKLHLQVKQQALSEVARVLRPGGHFLVFDFLRRNEAIGLPLMSEHFYESRIHVPSRPELQRIQRAGNFSAQRISDDLEEGRFRTLIGIKSN